MYDLALFLQSWIVMTERNADRKRQWINLTLLFYVKAMLPRGFVINISVL